MTLERQTERAYVQALRYEKMKQLLAPEVMTIPRRIGFRDQPPAPNGHRHMYLYKDLTCECGRTMPVQWIQQGGLIRHDIMRKIMAERRAHMVRENMYAFFAAEDDRDGLLYESTMRARER